MIRVLAKNVRRMGETASRIGAFLEQTQSKPIRTVDDAVDIWVRKGVHNDKGTHRGVVGADAILYEMFSVVHKEEVRRILKLIEESITAGYHELVLEYYDIVTANSIMSELQNRGFDVEKQEYINNSEYLHSEIKKTLLLIKGWRVPTRS